MLGLKKMDVTDTEKEHIELRLFIFLILMLIWAIPQSMVMIQPLPGTIVQFLFHLKNPGGVVAFAIGSLLYLDKIRIESIAVPAWLFCVYTLFSSLVQSLSSPLPLNALYSPFMYFVWMWGVFVLVPSVFDTQEKLKAFLRWIIWITVVLVILGAVWTAARGIPLFKIYWGSRQGAARYFFGFRHAGYFAAIMLSILFGGLFLRNVSVNRLERRLLMVVVIAAAVVIYVTDSRSSMIMGITALCVYWALQTKQHRWLIYLLGVALVSILLNAILTISALENPVAYLNYVSSGRVRLWLSLIEMITGSGKTVLFGSDIARGGVTLLETATGETSSSLFPRYRIDSTYMDLSVGYGVPAMILFVATFYYLLRTALSARRTGLLAKSNRLNLNLAIGVVCGLLVHLLTTSRIPSMGNLLNIVLLPACTASIIRAHRTADVKPGSSI